MTDEQMIDEFEGGRMHAGFHHEDHVRLAVAYLRTHSVISGLERFAAGLKKLAAASDRADRYSETLTYAYYFLIHERLATCEDKSWEAFCSRNLDIFEPNHAVLTRYYREETLHSKQARTTFILPDRSLAP